MKNMKNLLLTILGSALAATAFAQFPEDKTMILLGSQKVNVSCVDTVFDVPFLANTEITLKTDAEWIEAKQIGDSKKIKIKLLNNENSEARTGIINVTSADGSLTRTLTIEQERENLATFIPTDIVVPVSRAETSSHQPGAEIQKSCDGDYGTTWHSNWNNSGENYFPITATYYFTDVDRIDYIRYVPPQSHNGPFKKFELYVKQEGDADFKKYGDYDFGGTTAASFISLGSNGLEKPVAIKFNILSGAGDGQGFATCAEMEFRKNNPEISGPDTEIFEGAWEGLKPGVDQADIDALSNPYAKFVAQKLLDDKDTFTKDRVQSYECVLSPNSLSAEWNTPGKLYDQLQGVTGINIPKGKQGVAVSGLAEGDYLTLKVVAWYSQNLNSEGVGGGPAEVSYTLRNGINVIDYNSDFDGLAYVAYYKSTDEEVENAPDIRVHFINAQVNGYLSPDRTNEELDVVLQNAKNRCIDLVGDKVHSIWQVSGMRNYCKAIDGTSKGYVQFMNVLDTLVGWEHYLLGFDKYNRVPKNRTMAYVNYTYYMFQGSYGVSFMYDQESRVLNCKTIMKNDGDAIWGLSHEWGHQHQMQPYFCWAGLGESSNNMNSCENVLRMGYTGDWHAKRIKDAWTNAYANFFTNVNATSTSEPRLRAYQNINRFIWSPAVQEEIKKQYATYYKNGEWQIPSIAQDKEHALSTNEVNVEQNTAPFYMLHNYFSYTLPKEGDSSKKDFQLDLYEALRQTDDPNGSVIEPGKTEVDKYELLASAQNGNKNGKYDEFVAKYPNSCWTKQKYIYTNYVNANGNDVKVNWTQNSVPFIFNYIRKASRISGYNLFDYFDKFGFLRTIIMTIGDYGDKDYVMMEDMKAEFKADMEALNLKEVDDEMMEKIAHSDLPVYPTPVIPNEPVK